MPSWKVKRSAAVAHVCALRRARRYSRRVRFSAGSLPRALLSDGPEQKPTPPYPPLGQKPKLQPTENTGSVLFIVQHPSEQMLSFVKGAHITLGGNLRVDESYLLIPGGVSKEHARITFDGLRAFIHQAGMSGERIMLNGRPLVHGKPAILRQQDRIKIGGSTLTVVHLHARSNAPKTPITKKESAIVTLWNISEGTKQYALVRGDDDKVVFIDRGGRCNSLPRTAKNDSMHAVFGFSASGTFSLKDLGSGTEVDDVHCIGRSMHLKQGTMLRINHSLVGTVAAINAPSLGRSGVFDSETLGYRSIGLLMRNQFCLRLDNNFFERLFDAESRIFRSFEDSEAADRRRVLQQWSRVMERKLRKISLLPGDFQKDEYRRVVDAVNYIFVLGRAAENPTAFFNLLSKRASCLLDLALASERLTVRSGELPVFERLRPGRNEQKLRKKLVNTLYESRKRGSPHGKQLLDLIDAIPEDMRGEIDRGEMERILRSGWDNYFAGLSMLNWQLNPMGIAVWLLKAKEARSEMICIGSVTHMASSDSGDIVLVKPVLKHRGMELPNFFGTPDGTVRSGIQAPVFGTIFLRMDRRAGKHDTSFRYHIQRYLDELTGFSASVRDSAGDDALEADARLEANALAASYYYSELANDRIRSMLFGMSGKVRNRAARMILEKMESGRGARSAIMAYMDEQYSGAVGVRYKSLLNRQQV